MNLTFFAIGFAALALLALAVSGYFTVKRWFFPVFKMTLESYWRGRWDIIDERLESLETDVAQLPRVWEEFASEAKKSQERARWHVRRVKKELEQRGLTDDEINSLDSEIRNRDGAGGDQGELLDLSDAMAKVSPAPEEDPIQKALRRKWANG